MWKKRDKESETNLSNPPDSNAKLFATNAHNRLTRLGGPRDVASTRFSRRDAREGRKGVERRRRGWIGGKNTSAARKQPSVFIRHQRRSLRQRALSPRREAHHLTTSVIRPAAVGATTHTIHHRRRSQRASRGLSKRTRRREGERTQSSRPAPNVTRAAIELRTVEARDARAQGRVSRRRRREGGSGRRKCL